MYKLIVWANVVKHCGGNLAENWENIHQEFEDLGKPQRGTMVYIKGGDCTRYGIHMSELKSTKQRKMISQPI